MLKDSTIVRDACGTSTDHWLPYTDEYTGWIPWCAVQIRFAVTVWVGLVRDCEIGLYHLLSRMTAVKYLIFLKQVLPGLLEDGLDVLPGLLDVSLASRLLYLLISLNFFLWGLLKSIIYASPAESEMDRVERFFRAAATIKE